MSLVEVYYKQGFGKRLRRIQAAAAAGLHKLNGRLYSSLPQHGGQVGGGPAGAPITRTIGGTGTATATITFAGGPAAAAGTVTLTADAGAAITGLTPVAIAQGDTAAQVATKVATMLDGKQDTGATVTLDAAAIGGVVTVTEAGGGNIATLTAVIA